VNRDQKRASSIAEFLMALGLLALFFSLLRGCL